MKIIGAVRHNGILTDNRKRVIVTLADLRQMWRAQPDGCAEPDYSYHQLGTRQRDVDSRSRHERPLELIDYAEEKLRFLTEIGREGKEFSGVSTGSEPVSRTAQQHSTLL